LLAALAGAGTTAEAAQPRSVAWEGRSYRVDVVGAELDRLRRIRERQGGASLDEALAVSRVGAKLAAGLQAVATVASVARELQELAERWRGPDLDILPSRDGWPDPAAVLDRTARELSKGPLPRTGDGEVVGARPVVELGDALVGDVLASIVYALALGDADGRAVRGSNVARRHDFGITGPGGEGSSRTAWLLPEARTQPGEPWHVSGALIGLDVGLASFALRHMGVTGDLRPPSLNTNDRRTFAEGVALMNVFDLTDADRDAIADAIRRGRARVAGAARDVETLRALAREAGVDGWRLQQVPWVVRHDLDQIDRTFALSELLQLGRVPAGVNVDAWGASAIAASGCLCTRVPTAPDWPSTIGRAEIGLIASRMPDLALRVAELLHELQLPAALARGVMAVATQDFVDRVEPADADDWRALAEAAASVSRDQVEDYVAAQTSGGPLLPAGSGNGPGQQP
jgi:hypothetical protein